MSSRTPHAEMMDELTRLTLRDLCHDCQVNAEYVIELVEFGVVQPRAGRSPWEWVFAGDDLVRVKKAERLRRDLDMDLPGVALSLELLEEVRQLRRRVEELERGMGSD
ncbi:chaperone modulator CbpM [Halomonadaceae bacterium KBTZ08]